MKYYVYCTKYNLVERKTKRWKGFDSYITAMVFMKVNGYKLIAKGK